MEVAPSGAQFAYARQGSPGGATVGAPTSMGYVDAYATGAHTKRGPCDAGSCVPLYATGNGHLGRFFVDGGKERAQVWTTADTYHGSEEPAVTGGRLGDATGRYLVRHDRTAGKLLLTDFHTGTVAPPREIADLPAGDTADQRRLTWAVDEFGGDIAYVGPDKAIRIVPSGVPTQPLAKIESDVDDGYIDLKDTSGGRRWESSWQLNAPATWTFVVKDLRGRTVRTISGGPGAEIEVNWNGRTDKGTHAFNELHTWTLTARAVKGGGTYTTSGKISVGGGLQGHHDQGGQDFGELVTLNSAGGPTLHCTEGRGKFDWKRSGAGWPKGTVAVPFGDMGGDGYGDVLAHDKKDGTLYRYDGTASGRLKERVKVFAAWGRSYDVIVGVGDITGDGRADIVERDGSGNLFRNNGDGKGSFGSRTKIATGWQGYKGIF
ncbi:FG-GAP repeat domain-containing protein [Streptomyces sp. NPDC001777]|uniref:FG-GAP repeat domain-containing protein n=1 Tax=Streptomyces sp. NPDC001777 TaxID=3364608 RepID=UPI0036963626